MRTMRLTRWTAVLQQRDGSLLHAQVTGPNEQQARRAAIDAVNVRLIRSGERYQPNWPRVVTMERGWVTND